MALRKPVPLDAPLDVTRENGSLRVLEGEELVAEARSVPEIDAEVPAPVSVEEARQARSRYRGKSEGPFSECFVCGLARDDALGVFAGPVEGRDLVASPWTPPEWAADESGRVRPEVVWGVLDCPTFFAAYGAQDELPIAVLARFSARVDGPILAGAEHVVIGWPIGIDGRKGHAGSAVLSADGETLAVARALMIELRDA